MKVCVMNCGPSTKDMRSRADIMSECHDCEDWPEPQESEADRLLLASAEALDSMVTEEGCDQRELDYARETLKQIRIYLKARK